MAHLSALEIILIVVPVGLVVVLALLRNKHSALRKRLAEVESRNSALQQYLKDAEGRNSDLEERLKETESERSALQESVKEAEIRNSDLQKRLEKADNQTSTLQQKIQKAERQNVDLQAQLEKAIGMVKDYEAESKTKLLEIQSLSRRCRGTSTTARRSPEAKRSVAQTLGVRIVDLFIGVEDPAEPKAAKRAGARSGAPRAKRRKR